VNWRHGVVFLSLLSATFGLSAQEANLSVSSALFPLEATVKDASGRLVLDLKENDFEIYEDGQLQPTRLFALTDAPRSTMLIFDRSESTEKQEPFMLQAVNSFTRSMHPTDRVAIFSFARELEVRLKWQAIGSGPFPRITMPSTKDWSGVYQSLEDANRRFDNEKGRRGIVMLTDGQDSELFNETKRLGGVLDIEKDGEFQKRLKKIRSMNIPIYFVALPADPRAESAYLNSSDYRGSSEYRSGLRSPTVGADYVVGAYRRMIKIAEVSGGRVLVSERMEDLASFYERIARELGESYSLGYAPAHAVEGGQYRKIEVRVRRPGLVVTQSRDGFQP